MQEEREIQRLTLELIELQVHSVCVEYVYGGSVYVVCVCVYVGCI